MKEKAFETFKEKVFGDYVSDNYILLQEQWTIKQAMRSLTEQAGNCDNPDMLFVVNDTGKYCGAIELKNLIIARAEHELTSLIDADYPFVYANRPIDENVEALSEFARGTLPVMDAEGHLAGVISVEDMLEIMEDEYGEDYAKLAGLASEEELQEPLWRSVVTRLPWLILLLGLGLLVSSVMGAFEQVVSRLSLAVCFQSLILGMAGNGGTQSLAVTVRLLAQGEEALRHGRRQILKEMGIGLCNGTALGLLSTVAIGGYLMLIYGESAMFAFSLSACIGAAMCIAMLVSAAAGTLIPLAFQKFGIDPAVASGPLITTFSDLSSVVIYYGLVWLFLLI